MNSSKNSIVELKEGTFLIHCDNHVNNDIEDIENIKQKQVSTKSNISDSNSINKLCNTGRWTDIEHLIFLACIMEFGKEWKKTEFYVRTRSSAQIRSHAQKVLRKTDKNSMLKEISELKVKLNFQPKEYKCEGLIYLNNNSSEEEKPIKAKRLSKYLENAEEGKLNEKESKHTDQLVSVTPNNLSTKIIQLKDYIEKPLNVEVITPQTCASNKLITFDDERQIIKSNNLCQENENINFSKLVNIEKVKPCFKILNNCMTQAKKNEIRNDENEVNNLCSIKSQYDQNLEHQDHKLDVNSLFDFDLYTIFKDYNEGFNFEEVLSLNSLAKKTNGLFEGNVFYEELIPMGDDKLPLCMQY